MKIWDNKKQEQNEINVPLPTKREEKPKRKEKGAKERKDRKEGFLYTCLSWLVRPAKQLRLNRQILVVAYFFAFLFVALMGYITYYVAIPGKEDATSSYNPRKNIFSERMIKGEIKTADDKTIAKSVKSGKDDYSRSYPAERMFAHVVGYDLYGKSGLEASANYYLYRSHSNVFGRIINDLRDEKNQGDTVYSTLDYDLQQTAYNALGGYKGAVVVMEPQTGKILAMVSKPDFNPNAISENYEMLNKDEDSALLNRATQGLYPPGSTFKIVTALEYIRENPKWKKFSYTCEGTTTIDHVRIKCAGNTAHGRVDLYGAMAHSCNNTFVTLASGLDFASFRKTAEQLQLNQKLPINLEYSKSRFVLDGKSPASEMPQTSIGQGDTLMTPLLNCMIVSSIANDGVMMTPYLTDYVESSDGKLVKKFTPSIYKEVMTENEAEELTKLLVKVVKEGSASTLSGLRHSYAGKTGSAEHQEGRNTHAWFVGFSPVKNPKIAVCVIAEDAGSGSSVAVPIAKKIFTTYYEKNK